MQYLTTRSSALDAYVTTVTDFSNPTASLPGLSPTENAELYSLEDVAAAALSTAVPSNGYASGGDTPAFSSISSAINAGQVPAWYSSLPDDAKIYLSHEWKILPPTGFTLEGAAATPSGSSAMTTGSATGKEASTAAATKSASSAASASSSAASASGSAKNAGTRPGAGFLATAAGVAGVLGLVAML